MRQSCMLRKCPLEWVDVTVGRYKSWYAAKDMTEVWA